jgi:hypothetical protein
VRNNSVPSSFLVLPGTCGRILGFTHQLLVSTFSATDIAVSQKRSHEKAEFLTDLL